jgi:BMFP domain-containing protein YqiC
MLLNCSFTTGKKMISTLTKSLLGDIFQSLPNAKAYTSEQFEQLQAQLNRQLESAIKGMNLVSRDEFNTQTAILTRTQNQVEALAQQLLELEKQMAEKTQQ